MDAAQAAISSPLLDFPITKAKGIVFNIVGGSDMTLQEINAAAEVWIWIMCIGCVYVWIRIGMLVCKCNCVCVCVCMYWVRERFVRVWSMHTHY
ncbi:hypothetical protein EON63_10690 [archaeon]|nr:MAG: hypothetical protein EON63_10690 [archaeon]